MYDKQPQSLDCGYFLSKIIYKVFEKRKVILCDMIWKKVNKCDYRKGKKNENKVYGDL